MMSGKSAHLGMKIAATLNALKEQAIETNAAMAEQLGVPQSAAITCVKPSGTVSQLVNSASGIHARHNPYYIRTVRGDNKAPPNTPNTCLLYTSPRPRDGLLSRMPSSA